MKNPGMRGKTEASTTRRFRVSMHAEVAARRRRSSPAAPIAHVPHAWWPQAFSRTNSASSASLDDVVAGHLFPGDQAPLAQRARHPPDEPDAFHDRFQIGVSAVGEVVEVDRRRVERIGRAQRHRAGAVAGVALEHDPGQRVQILREHAGIARVVALETREQRHAEQVRAAARRAPIA